MVANSNPISGNGNYLSVTNSGSTADGSVTRAFDGLSSASAYTLSFSLRLDYIAGWNNNTDYVTLSGGSSAAGNPSSTSSFLIRAYGNTIGTASAFRWSFYNGNQDSGGFNANLWVSSTMAVTEGTTYNFLINVNPTARTYSATINDGTTSVNSGTMGFRTSAFDGGSFVQFNMRNDIASDTSIISLDNLAVVPEPSTFASLLAVSLVGFLATGYSKLRRRRV